MTIPRLSDLHDAVLESVDVQWATARCTLTVRIGDPLAGRWTIVFESVTSLSLGHELPWGPSVSILEAKERDVDGAVELHFTMQSGDDIVVRAKRFEVVRL